MNLNGLQLPTEQHKCHKCGTEWFEDTEEKQKKVQCPMCKKMTDKGMK